MGKTSGGGCAKLGRQTNNPCFQRWKMRWPKRWERRVRKHLAKHPNDKQAKAALGRIMEAVVKRYE